MKLLTALQNRVSRTDRTARLLGIVITVIVSISPCFPQTQPEVFDVSYYEGINPDIMNVDGSNTTAATNHWVNWGLPQEGRRANPIFDPKYYLQNNPDLLAAFGPNGYAAAANHFLSTGLPLEGRRGSLEFDVKYYLANNPDLVAAYGATGYKAAADHFLVQGLPNEGRQGSADFSIKTYINKYPDVLAGYGATDYNDAMMHWLRRGKGFGRSGIGTVALPADCTAQAPPQGFTRIYIGFRTDGLAGSGTASDPFDGSTAQKFDTILRGYTRDPGAGVPSVDHLIVCIGQGNFETEGAYDYVINIPHGAPNPNSNRGFALGPYWHIHGSGTGSTVLKLVSFFVSVSGDQSDPWLPAGSGTVFSTGSDFSPGIEISDLTIDDNYPGLKPQATQQGVAGVNLEAVHLRGDQGGHWIHNINVLNSAGELSEAFPIWIASVNNSSPTQNGGNLIEFVTMSHWGAGSCTAIAVANAGGEVRFNVVSTYEKGYGGWSMPAVWFHDNFAILTNYGFNIDSLNNNGVLAQYNQIILAKSYGIVVGGSGTYSNFTFQYNTISLYYGAVALVIQGNVTNSIFSRTSLITSNLAGATGTAIWVRNSGNFGNVFQFNQLLSGYPVTFSSPSSEFQNCAFGNWDQLGTQRSDFPNTQGTQCVSGQ